MLSPTSTSEARSQGNCGDKFPAAGAGAGAETKDHGTRTEWERAQDSTGSIIEAIATSRGDQGNDCEDTRRENKWKSARGHVDRDPGSSR